jgi:hypothetical protein
MIRFSLHGPPPRGVRGEPVHGIVSRSTLYGIHRPIMRPDLDVHCSKTTLLFFTNRGAANMFASRFLQKNPALRRPWRLESMPFEDLQKICLLNYLDTYLCFHASQATAAAFEAGRAGAGSGAGSGAESGCEDSEGEACAVSGSGGVILDCYEYRSAEYPSRQILNMIMENMWRRN